MKPILAFLAVLLVGGGCQTEEERRDAEILEEIEEAMKESRENAPDPAELERQRLEAEAKARIVSQAQQAARAARRQQDRDSMFFPESFTGGGNSDEQSAEPASQQAPSSSVGTSAVAATPEPRPEPPIARQEVADQIAALKALHDELVGHLKAIQDAQTDVWEKRWAGDEVTTVTLPPKTENPNIQLGPVLGGKVSLRVNDGRSSCNNHPPDHSRIFLWLEDGRDLRSPAPAPDTNARGQTVRG